MSLSDSFYDDEAHLGEENDIKDPSFRRSFLNLHVETKESKAMLQQFSEYSEELNADVRDATYDPKQIYPQWMRHHKNWIGSVATHHNEISEILEKPKKQRTEVDWKSLVVWLMKTWHTANELGPKRCLAMTKAFHFFHYEPGTDIITEGDRGLVFYIIVDGTVDILKNGVGKVAEIGKGKSFGEIALSGKAGSDMRTATVRAQTKVQTLSLHKSDYETFVKDIKMLEMRENLTIFRRCALFQGWPRAKIDKMSSHSSRRDVNDGTEIFKQGDEPDFVYIVIEGQVEIIKEVKITSRNRWPEGMREWGGKARQTMKRIVVDIVKKDGFFGELSVLKRTGRHASARAVGSTQLLRLGHLEFLHLLQSDQSESGREQLPDETQDKLTSNADEKLLRMFKHVAGGPSSTIETFGASISNKGMNKREEKEKRVRARHSSTLAKVQGGPHSSSPTHGGATRRPESPSSRPGSSYDGETVATDMTGANRSMISRVSQGSMFLGKLKDELYSDDTFGQKVKDARHRDAITAQDLIDMEAEAEAEEEMMHKKALHVEDLKVRQEESLSSLRASQPRTKRVTIADLRHAVHDRFERDIGKASNESAHSIAKGASKKDLQARLDAHANRASRHTTNQSLVEHTSEIHKPTQRIQQRTWVVPKSAAVNRDGKKMSRFEQHVMHSKEHKKNVMRRAKSLSIDHLERTSGRNLLLSIGEHHMENHRTSRPAEDHESARRSRAQEESEGVLERMEIERAKQAAAEVEARREEEAVEQVREEQEKRQVSQSASKEGGEELPEWIHDKDDLAEEQAIRDLDARELADFFDEFQYGHTRHENMIANLDFDIDAYRGKSDLEAYSEEEIEHSRHSTIDHLDEFEQQHKLKLARGERAMDQKDEVNPIKSSDEPDAADGPHVWRNYASKPKPKPEPNMNIIRKARLTFKDIFDQES